MGHIRARRVQCGVYELPTIIFVVLVRSLQWRPVALRKSTKPHFAMEVVSKRVIVKDPSQSQAVENGSSFFSTGRRWKSQQTKSLCNCMSSESEVIISSTISNYSIGDETVFPYLSNRRKLGHSHHSHHHTNRQRNRFLGPDQSLLHVVSYPRTGSQC